MVFGQALISLKKKVSMLLADSYWLFASCTMRQTPCYLPPQSVIGIAGLRQLFLWKKMMKCRSDELSENLAGNDDHHYQRA
jgi:hypothetical protein